MKITIYLIALIAGSIIGYSILEKSKFESFDIVGQVNKIDPKQTFFNIWDTIVSVKVNIKYDAKTDKVNIKIRFMILVIDSNLFFDNGANVRLLI